MGQIAAVAWRLGVAAVVWLVVGAGQDRYGNRHNFSDLRIYHLAVRWWRDGRPLYDFSVPDPTQGSLGFTYPPFAAMMLRPLAGFAWPVPVQVAFGTVSVLAFAVSLWLLSLPVARHLGQPTWFVFLVAVPLASALEPIRETFTFGQVNFVLVALVLVDLLVLGAVGSRWTGVGIGLAAAVKLTPGVFVLYLLCTRRWRAAGVATATATAATAAAWVVAPGDSWTYWTRTLLDGDGIGHPEYLFNQSLMGIVARASDPPQRVLWLLLVAAVVGFGMWRAARAYTGGGELTGLTLAGLVGCLASPVTWVHHIFWFIPAMLLLVIAGTRPLRWPPLLGAAVVYVTVTFSVISLYAYDLHEPGGVTGAVLGNWDALLMLALLAAMPASLSREPVARPSSNATGQIPSISS
ncbi:glycosyltransferase 87 family protein [Dactylosporangium sp. AC04546]|uniref:glycosyltransferase 87 family protein n=1 Tax=Dactylosporangium sp. AC04546 TaxID=2862460 RepID=UPI001EE14EB1|nr:glycosyltransferase 87 family protein [Dactylosporangium sp. AC04546]WVK80815.1 glycosyltransferase 87 family protein [Dactylosporangium sp. AC04546]